MNKVYKHRQFKAFLSENKISIIVVLENREKENKTHKIIDKITKQWKYNGIPIMHKVVGEHGSYGTLL